VGAVPIELQARAACARELARIHEQGGDLLERLKTYESSGEHVVDKFDVEASCTSPFALLLQSYEALCLPRREVECDEGCHYEVWRQALPRPKVVKTDKSTAEGRGKARAWAVAQVETADHAGDAIRTCVDGSMVIDEGGGSKEGRGRGHHPDPGEGTCSPGVEGH
jgi:hypothetical protein